VKLGSAFEDMLTKQTRNTSCQKTCLADLPADLPVGEGHARDREKSDYKEAKEEMEKAIKALTASIEVPKEATKDHKTGVCAKCESDFE